MAIYLPIVTQFNSKGLKEAEKGFKDLEGAQAKAKYALGKANKYAAVALGALVAGLGDAVKGAMEDEQAQLLLARQLQKTTNATDKQIASVETYITQQGKLKGVTDDELRPALAGLVRATGDIAKAQESANLAMDIAAAKGVSLESVTKAMERAYGGNMTALAKLSPELRDMIKRGASLEQVMAQMAKTFGGAASDAANTTAGKFKTMKIALDETKESIGAALLPAVEAVLPYLQGLADWAQKNPNTFTIIAAALAAIAASIVLINIAMALNPIGLIVIAVGLVIAALAIAYTKFEGFRNIIDKVFGAIKWYVLNVALPYFKILGQVVKQIFDGIKIAWNSTIGGLNFKFPDWLKYTGPLGMLLAGKSISIPKIGESGGGEMSSVRAFEESQKATVTTAASATNFDAAIAAGGSSPQVTKPVELIAPTGTGTNTMAGSLAGVGGFNGYNVNIEVNGGDPNAVVDALRTYMRQNGSVPIKVSDAF